MTLCGPPSPVFYLTADIPMPLLDRMVGDQLAQSMRSLYAPPWNGDLMVTPPFAKVAI